MIGGKAGEGVKKAGLTASRLFAGMGRQVFQMDDYQSLIKGGHNFSVISTATRNITSHYMKADLVVALDKKSYDLHRDHVSPDGIFVYNSDVVKDGVGIGLPMTVEAKKYSNPELIIGLAGVSVLAAIMDNSEERFEEFIKAEYSRDVEENLAYSKTIFKMACENIEVRYDLESGDVARPIFTGNELIALGAAAGGLDVYVAYPMTPSSSILHYLAAKVRDLGIAVVHPENEIAVINMAIGSAYAGARSMVGSSGGGFALMEEALSLAGMSETPILCVLSSRPGPSTGVPTYTSQGDLRFALNQGHGEFSSIVASPGSMEEAFYLTAEMLDLVWKLQTVGILLTEKHLSESTKTVEIDAEKTSWSDPLMHESGEYKRYEITESGITPMLFPPSEEIIKWNSYDHDESGITTEEPGKVKIMRDKLVKKKETIIEHIKHMRTVNTFGSGSTRIFTYGSTTMSVLEAVAAADIDATVVQPVYLEPLPVWELDKYTNGGNAIVIEQSSMGQFETLLRDKMRIDDIQAIRRYDGLPFEPVELAEDIRRLL